jgi:hypothetical protein
VSTERGGLLELFEMPAKKDEMMFMLTSVRSDIGGH